MVRQAVSSPNRVVCVVGLAGAGKTTATRAAGEAFRSAGVPVFGAAPSGIAAEKLQDATGIPSTTLHRLLQTELPDRCVVIVDEAGMAETRVLTTQGHAQLPDDAYALVESYCVDPTCHCRRVMLNVFSRRGQRILASIGFGFDRDDEFAGPYLDPLNPQSEYAEVLLKLTKPILADPTYVARLESHYYQVKGAVADPGHLARRILGGGPKRGTGTRSRRTAPRKRKR